MTRAEKRCWDWIIQHRLKFLIAVSTLLSLWARYGLRTIVSGDMQSCLLPWYDVIDSLGGIKALSVQIGNYNIPYQTAIALLTYLPIIPIYAYKGLSIFFDYALGVAVAAGVYELTKNRTKACVSYTAVIMLPTVLLNSAAWGQCDSIFTFFMVASFVLLMKNRYPAAFLMYGCSFAFKLQAVFFLPFLIFYYVWSRKISILHFLLALIPIIVLSLGALLQGRSISSLFTVYQDQIIAEEPKISWNYPSFWLLLVKNFTFDGSDHYQEVYPLCIAVTVILLGLIMLCFIRREKMDSAALLLTAAWMLYTCVFFLPSMHDRYAYPAVIFILFACFVKPELIPAALGLLFLETEIYASGLLFKTPLSWELKSLVNLACYAGVAFITVRSAGRQEELR